MSSKHLRRENAVTMDQNANHTFAFLRVDEVLDCSLQTAEDSLEDRVVSQGALQKITTPGKIGAAIAEGKHRENKGASSLHPLE